MDTPTRLLPQMGDMYEGIKRLFTFLSEAPPGRSLRHKQFQCALLNPLFRIFIFQDSRRVYPENVVGMASIFYVHKLGGTIAEIHDVVVDPVCRGEGIGERLVRGLIADAQRYAGEIGNDIVISLTSRPSRVAANELYLKLGFELTARHLRKNKESFGTNLYRMTITSSS
jgi:ribosomal protein S18 acetylase RimI-like enzyme